MPAYATNIPDLLKIALIAWVMIFTINTALRKAGLPQYTTKGN